MVIIRGATTVEKDCKEDIRQAVKELLDEVTEQNELTKSEIMSIVLSSTSDIHSYYPAKAAREAGFEASALFSATEPDIQGGLKLCIRVMLFVEKNLVAHHVYLHGAKSLRTDLTRRYAVAIDGPAGSGKSTVARALASDYRILYLDTGAMYRACAFEAMLRGVDVANEEAVKELMKDMEIDVRYEGGVQRTFACGIEVTEKIRTGEISMAASTISRYACVREKLVEKQREIARMTSCVLDGRDIGTNVLPNAEYKFFLTASVAVRAKRRYEELKAKGQEVTLEEITKDIQKRDEQDRTRAVAPLKKAEDAVEIDTTDLTIDEVLAAVKKKIQENV